MAAKTSVRAAQRAAISAENKLTKAWAKSSRINTDIPAGPRTVTTDSFQNFLLGMGMGTDNANGASTYGFNPITRNRILCEWIYRGSWVGGVGVDLIANDMTRAGIDYPNSMEATDTGKLTRCASRMDVWSQINQTIKWGRLYGGSICVALIDGQDLRTPLRIETVGKDAFKGLLTLDRWMVEPSLDDLVTDMGPHLGMPKFYKVLSSAPSLRGKVIHHTRVMVRHCGVRLPYNQALAENLWGLSIYERIYDRMTAFDMASNGAAQLVGKCWLRTIKIKDLRQIVAAGGAMMQGLVQTINFMRRTQTIEGITLIDGDDELQIEQHQAFSGLDSILTQFASQIAGGWQIPMTRLLGQSPGGLNATGVSDDNIYDDNIAQAQKNELYHGVQTVWQLMAASEGVKLPDDFDIVFSSLTQLPDSMKSDIANKDVDTVLKAYSEGLISQQVALMELKQLSSRSGRFTNITQKMINEADEELPEQPPGPDELMQLQSDIDKGNATHAASLQPKADDSDVPGNEKDGNTSRSNGKTATVADRQARRVCLSD